MIIQIIILIGVLDALDRLRSTLGYSESAQKVKKLELLKQLYTSPYRDRKDRNPERVDGTCEWFTNHPLFRSWHESKTSSLLWLSSDPGGASRF
jgi:hypothetical protein